MTPRRLIRSDEHADSSEQLFPILASETLRGAAAPHHAEPSKPHEEKISVFWRIFGGTILSIVALLVITAYQSINNSINDLRTSVSHLNEAKADFVKKDENSASRTRTWDRIAEVQKEVAAITAPLHQLKDRIGQIEEHAKTSAAERKEMHELQATTKERLTQFDLQLGAVKTNQKEMATVQQALSALQEKATLRDQQLKQIEDERKELLKEIQALRERLARVEATKSAAPAKPAKSGEDLDGDK